MVRGRDPPVPVVNRQEGKGKSLDELGPGEVGGSGSGREPKGRYRTVRVDG